MIVSTKWNVVKIWTSFCASLNTITSFNTISSNFIRSIILKLEQTTFILELTFSRNYTKFFVGNNSLINCFIRYTVEFCYLVRDSNRAYVKYELQGFKDASTEAYGVYLYRREETVSEIIKCILITSKSRIAPIN